MQSSPTNLPSLPAGETSVVTPPAAHSLRITPERLTEILRDASEIAWDLYRRGPLMVRAKSDGSRVTDIDLILHEYLKEMLCQIDVGAYVSEEGDLDATERLGKELVWIVDPIDNTAGLVDHGLHESNINVVLVENGAPILGATHYFSDNSTFLFGRGLGILRAHGGDLLRVSVPTVAEPPTFATYRGTLPELSPKMNELHRLAGSEQPRLIQVPRLPLRIRALIEGVADIYMDPRRVREWDVAPGFAAMEAIGGSGVSLTGQPILFNSESLFVEPFILARPGLDISGILARIAPVVS